MRSPSIFLLAILITISLGCQVSRSPVLPETDPDADLSVSPQSSSPVNRNLWAYYQCEANLETGQIYPVPMRSAEIHLNATQPLNLNPGLSFSIQPGSNPATGYFILDVTLTHPFAGSSSLTGFDVRGILLSWGSITAGTYRWPGENDTRLLNPDGLSRWWNPSEFTTPGMLGYVKGLFSNHGTDGYPTATINGYKAFGDGLWATGDTSFFTTKSLTDPTGRAVFKSGNSNTRQYEIQFPVNGAPKIRFDYAIDASWAPPNPNPPSNIPGDFPMIANSPEAFIVDATVTSCNIGGTPFGGYGSGQLELSIELWDWQGWAAGTYDGEIGNVNLYSPDIVFDPTVVERTDGFNNTFLTVTATGTPSIIGTTPVLIEIQAAGTSYKQTGADAPQAPVAAYALTSIEVVTAECESDENVECTDAVNIGLQESISDAVCSPMDQSDYYLLTIPTGTIMEGTITLNNYDYGDNDLLLYDGCPGNIIESSMNSYGTTEVINLDNIESGMYYIAVLVGGTAGTDVQPYNLVTDISPDTSQCSLDNNNEYTTATYVGIQDSINGTVCQGGDLRDWFRFDIPNDKVAGGTIYVDNLGDGNIDARVYDFYPGPTTFWSYNDDTQDEMVNVTGLGPGTHYIMLFASGSTPEGDRGFSMDIDLILDDYDCTSGDGNDTWVTADPLGFTDSTSGTVCFPGDNDWYMFVVGQNKEVSGTITLSGNDVWDNDLYFFGDPEGEPLEYSVHTGIMDEQVEVEGLGVGSYYVRASAHNSIGNGDQDFVLTFDLEEKAVGNCDFEIHAHIARKSDGSNPATTESKVQDDVDWANEFWSEWDGSFTLTEISYISNTALLACTSNEAYQCHQIYRDTSGPINVYYVNSFPDKPNATAYCRMDCRPMYQTHNSTYVFMSDQAKNRTLAHELGHATGIFHDVYLLDMGYSNCNQINYDYCAYGTNWSYCDEDDADYGNLMYFGVSGWNNPWNYWLSDDNWQDAETPVLSQVQNWYRFQTKYPNNF